MKTMFDLVFYIIVMLVYFVGVWAGYRLGKEAINNGN